VEHRAHDAVVGSEVDQLVGLVCCHRHRFLDDHVATGFDRHPGVVEMTKRR
jgi:hypothetical protein